MAKAIPCIVRGEAKKEWEGCDALLERVFGKCFLKLWQFLFP
jgi:hypothetical protein